MSIYKILFLSAFAFWSPTLFGQTDSTLLEEFSLVCKHFSQKQDIAYKANFKLFEDLDAEKPESQLLMDIRFKDDQYYCQFETFELYREGKDVAYLDHSSQQILLASQEIMGELSMGADFQQMESWIKFLDLKGTSYNPGENLNGIRFESKGETNSVIELEYNPTTLLVTRSFFAMDLGNHSQELRDELDLPFDQKKMEVLYSDFEMGKIVFPNEIKNILRSKGENLKGSFAKYKVSVI